MSLQVKTIEGKGRGVIARRNFSKGDIIEVCPVIVIPKKDCVHIDKTRVAHFYYEWGKDEGAISLGNGSLYNHSFTPNAEYLHKESQLCIWIKAIKDIKRGQEIEINYNGDHDCEEAIHFEDGTKLKPKK